MRDRFAGHRHRDQAVEFMTQFLPFLPGEELLQGHRRANSASIRSMVLGRSPAFAGDDEESGG